MTSEKVEQKSEDFELESESTYQNETKHILLKSGIKIKPVYLSKDKVLQGKALQIYWYILTHKSAGVREIQKSLDFASPGTVSYQLKKLLQAGIILKKEKDGKYYLKKESKKGLLGFYIRVGYFLIPRFTLYLIFYILGFIVYIFFACIYGDTFILNPGGLLLLFFLIFGTAIFMFESIKIWKTRPVKLK
ncbi:MAG: hypothetical protein ACFE9X_07025 [Promethearchaeota archaeon]